MAPAEDDILRCLWRKCRNAGPFSSDKELYEHLEEVHTVYKQNVEFKCRWDGCGKRYGRTMSRRDRARHLITHTDHRPYVCTRRSCGASFYRKDHLKKHRDAHANEREEVDASDGGESHVARAPAEVACKICNQSFPSAPVMNNTSAVSCLDVEDWSDEEVYSSMPNPVHNEPTPTGDPEGLTRGVSDAERLLAAEKRIRELEALLRDRQ